MYSKKPTTSNVPSVPSQATITDTKAVDTATKAVDAATKAVDAANARDIIAAQKETAATIVTANSIINTPFTNDDITVAISAVGIAAQSTSNAAQLMGKSLVNIPSNWKYIQFDPPADENTGQPAGQPVALSNISAVFIFTKSYGTTSNYNSIFYNIATKSEYGLALCTLFNATDGTLRSINAKNKTDYSTMELNSNTSLGDRYYYYASYIIANGNLSSDKNAALQQIIDSLAS